MDESLLDQTQLGVEPLLLLIERESAEVARASRLPGRCSRHVPPRGGSGDSPGHAGGTMSLGSPGNASRSWSRCLGRVESGHLCLVCCPLYPVPDKQKTRSMSRFSVAIPSRPIMFFFYFKVMD
ncbi:hypothetical protein XENOCAPTIV_023326 [Xenoophorus captivus]|uniref:Uncharacterized protein n=1 Tax=Xenoophorus captivus TaxID=1517983 RepID=A0ABV0R4I3_9TELE